MSRATARIVLEQGTLRWSSPTTLNDPYDNKFDLHLDHDHEEVRRLALAKLWDDYSGIEPAPAVNATGILVRVLRERVPGMSRAQLEAHLGPSIEDGLRSGDRTIDQFHRDIRPAMATNKLLCLTTNPINTLMWAYYAEHHQGVVLRFRCVDGGDSPWPAGKAVVYSKQMPRLFDAESLSDLLAGRASIDPMSAMYKIVFTKSIDWAHECEWRIFAGSGRNPNTSYEDIGFGTEELDGVVLGIRMPQGDREAITEIAKRRYPHAKRLENVTRDREFGLDIHPSPLDHPTGEIRSPHRRCGAPKADLMPT